MLSKSIQSLQQMLFSLDGFPDSLAVSAPLLFCGSLALGLGLYVTRRKTKNDVRGAVILITGCDSGFGFSLALHCAQMGMEVVAGCFAMGEGREVLEKTENVTVVELDVTEDESVLKAVDQVQHVCGDKGLYCLVNNAATLVFGEATWQTEEQILNQVHVNMVGPLRMTKALLPLLAKAKGRVVNMISNCTECPLPTLSVYTATKAGLLALSDGMRPEVKKYGVTIVIVNPGDAPFDTPLTSGQSVNYEKMEEKMTEEAKKVYGNYFDKCREKFSTLFPMPPLKKIVEPSYYKTMESVLQAKSPKAFYENSPLITGMIFGIIKRLPRTMADVLRLKLMKLPESNITRND